MVCRVTVYQHALLGPGFEIFQYNSFLLENASFCETLFFLNVPRRLTVWKMTFCERVLGVSGNSACAWLHVLFRDRQIEEQVKRQTLQGLYPPGTCCLLV